MDDRLKDTLETIVRSMRDADGLDSARLRLGVVFAVSSDMRTADIKLGGSAVVIPSVPVLNPYAPTINDVVQVLQQGPSLLIIGVTSDQTTFARPTRGLWATTRSQFQLFGNNTTNAGNHAEMCRFHDDLESAIAGTYAVPNVNHLFTDTSASGGGVLVKQSPDAKSTEYLGYIDINEIGAWEFSVDGDDAQELFVAGRLVSAVYGGHGVDGLLAARKNTISFGAIGPQLFCHRQQNGGGGSSAYAYYRSPSMVAAAAPMAIIPESRFIRPSLSDLPGLRESATRRTWTVLGTNTFFSPAVSGTPLVYQNGWKAYNDGTFTDAHGAAGFYRTRQGLVVMQGIATVPATNPNFPIFFLPSGYRPFRNRIFASVANDAYCQVRITAADGAVYPNGGATANGWLSIAYTFQSDQ